MWLEQMKMIMNEYRLNLGTQEAQEFLLKQMEDYFFGAGAALPPGLRSSSKPRIKSPEGRLLFRTAAAGVNFAGHGPRRQANPPREDETQVTGSFRKRDQPLTLLGGNDHVFDRRFRAGFFQAFRIHVDSLAWNRDHHDTRKPAAGQCDGARSSPAAWRRISSSSPGKTRAHNPPIGRAATSNIQTPAPFTRISAWMGP